MGMAGASAPQAALLAHPGSCCIQLKPQVMCSSPGSPPLLAIPSWLPALFQDWMNPRMELWVARRVSSPHPSHRNPLESASLLDLMAPKKSIYPSQSCHLQQDVSSVMHCLRSCPCFSQCLLSPGNSSLPCFPSNPAL